MLQPKNLLFESIDTQQKCLWQAKVSQNDNKIELFQYFLMPLKNSCDGIFFRFHLVGNKVKIQSFIINQILFWAKVSQNNDKIRFF